MIAEIEDKLVSWWEAERARREQPWHMHRNQEARRRLFVATLTAEQAARDALFASIESRHPAPPGGPRPPSRQSYAPLPRLSFHPLDRGPGAA